MLLSGGTTHEHSESPRKRGGPFLGANKGVWQTLAGIEQRKLRTFARLHTLSRLVALALRHRNRNEMYMGRKQRTFQISLQGDDS
jgi:hypothetical protein